jgi:hypothetical protein
MRQSRATIDAVAASKHKPSNKLKPNLTGTDAAHSEDGPGRIDHLHLQERTVQN